MKNLWIVAMLLLAVDGAVIRVEGADRRQPIFEAQAAYLDGKLDTAWQQYLTHRAQAVTLCKELDPSFAVWLVERRTSLGNYEEAEALARALLQAADAPPKTITTDARGRLLVAYAGIAFARQEYPRARAQFEQVAAAKEFADTPAQRAAELKVAEVDRLTRNYDRAMELLEKLARRKDPELQAEANYQMAAVKFDQEQYPEVRTHIDRVLAIEPTHAGARILEGRLYLKLKKLVEATEVKVGLAASQRTLVPGKPLKVQLEDRNLAIVGKAQDIEIRVWTDGGDEEVFNLLPFGDSKTRFEGQIPTALAPVRKGDRLLQVLGHEKVRYDFSERFKAANKIAAGAAMEIAVVSDGELYVSSGKILSKAEQEQRALEKLIRSRLKTEETAQDAVQQVALSTVRDENELKPGAKINVRVIDPDTSVTALKDKIMVRVAAASGDQISACPLEETDTHSGVFEGQIPTAAAPAMASASDSEEGKDPNFAIASGEHPPWVAAPDNRRPKTFNVDLNQDLALGKLDIRADVPGRRLKNFLLQTSLNGREFVSVGGWPNPVAGWDGALRMEVVRYDGKGGAQATVEQLREYLDVGCVLARAEKLAVTPAALTLKWDDKVGGHAKKLGLTKDGWYLVHLSGAFHLPQRQVRTFQMDQPVPAPNVRCFVTVDGQPGREPQTVTRSLAKGAHRLDLYLLAQRTAAAAFTLQCDIPTPPYLGACPVAMFDPVQHPDLAKAVRFQPATITASSTNTVFEVTFAPGTHARVLRLWLTDFETTAPALNKLTLTGADGKAILPLAQDIVSLRKNQTLELVPGDRITVTYDDEYHIAPGKRPLEDFLTATFHDATLSACFVDSTVDTAGNRKPQYIPMRRFKAGDVVNVFIHDPDGDVGDAQDKVKFRARVGEGAPVDLEALETAAHSGTFLGKVFTVTGAPQRPGELTVAKGDDVTVEYLDAENTDPGIPWTRTCAIEQVVDATPQLRVYDVTSRALDEKEMAAAVKSADPRHLDEFVPVTRTIEVARPEAATRDTPSIGLLGCPLVVELLYPTIVQTLLSDATIYVQTGKGPFNVDAPGTIKLRRVVGDAGQLPPPPGYREVLVRGDVRAGDALDDGRFMFVVPMQLGEPAEQDDGSKTETVLRTPTVDARGRTGWADERAQVRALRVRGNDPITVGFSYITADGATNWLTQQVTLRGDALFDLMDRKYQQPVTALHVGENVYFRAIDPLSDVSAAKDEVPVTVIASSGTTNIVKLTETFAHSGMFKGVSTLAFAGDQARAAEPGAVAVKYGDTVRAVYAPTNHQSSLERPMQVFKGATGLVLPFTKRFKDPDIAVQTQFTVAEACFELAKKHRELAQEDQARREIAQGKKLLEEAIRDYPNTETRAQADYLLADLALEFANDATDAEVKRKFYTEAVGRFGDLVATYPDSLYAPKAQYKKALVYEKQGQLEQACEEYVKLSYRYPDNELVAETIARLGQFFLTRGKEFEEKAKAQSANAVEREKITMQARDMLKTAAEVFGRLSERFPDHKLAGKTQVLSAQCYMRAADLPKAIRVFTKVVEEKRAEPDLIAQAMYWCGDCEMKNSPPDFVKAYRMFKKLTWDYPEGQWAKYARGRLTEPALAKVEADEMAPGGH